MRLSMRGNVGIGSRVHDFVSESLTTRRTMHPHRRYVSIGPHFLQWISVGCRSQRLELVLKERIERIERVRSKIGVGRRTDIIIAIKSLRHRLPQFCQIVVLTGDVIHSVVTLLGEIDMLLSVNSNPTIAD